MQYYTLLWVTGYCRIILFTSGNIEREQKGKKEDNLNTKRSEKATITYS